MSVTITISTTLFDSIQILASKYTAREIDWSVDDYAGGNTDDAYWQGWDFGKQELADSIVKSYDYEASKL